MVLISHLGIHLIFCEAILYLCKKLNKFIFFLRWLLKRRLYRQRSLRKLIKQRILGLAREAFEFAEQLLLQSVLVLLFHSHLANEVSVAIIGFISKL